MRHLSACLSFDDQAEDAAAFYTSLFENPRILATARNGEVTARGTGRPIGSVLTVDFELDGFRVLALNGGPAFEQTPAMSNFVWCDTAEEVDRLWAALSVGGTVHMGLDKYAWSERYGWTSDRFGVEWQILLAPQKAPQKIAPAMLFVRENFGRAQEAIRLYTSLLPDARVDMIEMDPSGKTVLHAQLSLAGQRVAVMEGQGTHDFTFSSAYSLMVYCRDQAEIDRLWDGLIADGGTPRQCGWLTDRFGVCWQIIPAEVAEWTRDATKHNAMMAALVTMTKLDYATLKHAYEHG